MADRAGQRQLAVKRSLAVCVAEFPVDIRHPPHPRQAFAIGAYAPVGRHVGDSRERERVRRGLLVSWRYAV